MNKDIEQFPHVFPITDDMHVTYEGVSRLVMLDRYSYKDSTKETLSEGDLVILTVKEDPKYPARGTGTVLIRKPQGTDCPHQSFRGIPAQHR